MSPNEYAKAIREKALELNELIEAAKSEHRRLTVSIDRHDVDSFNGVYPIIDVTVSLELKGDVYG